MKEAFQFDVDGQCDQIGRFFKVLGNKFAHKISPKRLGTFWAISKRIIVCKNCCFYYLGYLYTTTSGHTDDGIHFVGRHYFFNSLNHLKTSQNVKYCKTNCSYITVSLRDAGCMHSAIG